MNWQLAQDWLSWIFGGDEPRHPLELHQVAARAIAVYFIGLGFIRVGKSRIVGGFTTIDIVVAFIIGSVLGRGITGDASISGTAMATAALVAVHWAMTRITYHSHAIGKIVKGQPYPLVSNGAVDQDAMRRAHISEADLEEAMHLAGVERLDQVRRAYKERNGEISVIRCDTDDVRERPNK